MAETNIKISLELADKAAQKALSDFIGKGDAADKSLSKLKKSGKSTFEEISLHIGKSIGVYDIFVGNLAANLATKAFDTLVASASKLFEVFIVDGIAAAQAQEDAINDLNTALAQTGQFTSETSKDLQKFADDLQRTTTFEDDVILKNAALIQSLGQLDKDGLKQATKSALDLSARLGIDLTAAATLVGKAAQGEIATFSKYGIAIQKGATDAQTFTNTLQALAVFSGTAESKVRTFSGALAQNQNTFGELTESIGNLIVLNPAVIATVNELSKIFNEITDSTNSQTESLKILVGEGLSITLGTMAYLVTMVDMVARGFQFLYGVTQLLTYPFLVLGSVIRGLTVGMDQAANEITDWTKNVAKNLSAFGQAGDGALADVSTGLLRMKNAADSGLGAMETGATKVVDPLNKAAGGVKKLSEEAEAANKRLESFAQGLIKQGEDAGTTAEQQLEIARMKSEQEQQILKEKLDNQLISYQEYQARRDEIDLEYEALRAEKAQEQFDLENQRLQDARTKNLITESEFQKARGQLEKNYANDQVKRELEINKRTLQNQKDRDRQEKQFAQAKLQAASDVFGALADIAALGGAKMFKIVKAFNLAEAITAGILSVQKAAASAPPPFNVPAIVSATVRSAANVAQIVATKPSGYEDGGIVPGTNFSGDRVAANVNSGEMILNRAQQTQLFRMANGSGGDNARIEGLLVSLIEAVRSTPVNVQVGGKTVVDTLRSEFERGRGAFA
jgi:hypothetical protein